MEQLKFVMTTVVLCSIFTIGNAQYSLVSDSLQKTTELTLELKLKYQPVQLNLNLGKIHQDNRPVFVFNQFGMYEQYNVLSADVSQQVQPFRPYFPSGGFYYTGNDRRRDSFNPHGSANIGSALVNGFINGILLGNKY
ncbi:hypothetical protein [Carboxylicivirga sp. RSCT41]|uniref:hypothetical protein n=1 Tax=Carboxylicivirga agarovorans TaxID=3417570 RepID=UPI003D35182C